MDSSDSSSSFVSVSLRNWANAPSSSEDSSSEESSDNCPPNRRQNSSMKRRLESSSADESSDEESPPIPHPKKVKHSRGCPPGDLSKEDANQTNTLIVQNCTHSCSVCDEEYNSSTRTPLCLPCGHTFCSSCLRGIQNVGSRLCPMCRGDIGVENIAQLQPCFQLIPGNDVLAPFKVSSNNLQKNQILNEGAVWNVTCVQQLLEVEGVLTSSSVRPKKVAMFVNGTFGVTHQQMTAFLSVLQRTRCAVSVIMQDSFLTANKVLLERDQQYLEGLVKGRCQVVEYRGFLSRNVFKHLERTWSLKTLGFVLTDATDVKTAIFAIEKPFTDTVDHYDISIPKHLKLNTITKKITVPRNAACVVHFCDTDDVNVKWIPNALETLFSLDSSFQLWLHRCRVSLRGADILLGIMRDRGIKTAKVEAVSLNHNEKHLMDSRCMKFNCQIDWTREQ